MIRAVLFRCLFLLGVLSCAAVYPLPAFGQVAPGVGYVFPPGGKAGTTVAVKLGGYDWTPDMQFFVDEPRVKLEVLSLPSAVLLHEPPFWFGIKSFTNDPPLPREVSARFVLPSDLPPGPIRWRVANANGGSNCGVFVVSTGTEVIEGESRHRPHRLSALPVIVSGRLRHIEAVNRYQFQAQRSGPVTCDLMARRLGSDFHGVLEVHDANGRRVAEAVDTEGLDPALTFCAEQGQSYTVSVRDLDYRGYRSFTYRLALTPGPRVLAAVPAAGRRGETRAVEFVGIGVASGQARLESVTRTVSFPNDAERSAFSYRLATPHGTAPDFPLLLSDLPEGVRPKAAEAALQPLTLPGAVTGVLAAPQAKDRYSFAGKKGEVWNLVAQARALGSPLDLTLAVMDPDGKELAFSDDLPGTTDPGLTLTLPLDGTYQIVVADASGTPRTPASIYRLCVSRSAVDFRLITVPIMNVPIGGSASLAVNAVREGGFNGAIELNITGLPPGVSVPPNLIIPPTANSLAVALTCAKNAPAGAALVKIVGVGKIGDRTLTRTAYAPATGNLAVRNPAENLVPAVLVATTLKPLFKIKPVEADGGRRVHRGATHLAELVVERHDGFAGEIVLDMAAVQSRHRQGIRGPVLTVAPGLHKIDYPVFLPEWLETARTSRLALVGMAKVPDPTGKERYVLAPMDGQITMSIEGALLKVAHVGAEITICPGEPFIMPLKLARSPKVTGSVSLELIVPKELAGLLKAEPLVMAPNQNAAQWKLTTTTDQRLIGIRKLTVRATALHVGFPVVSETTIEIEFVAGPRRPYGKVNAGP